jgi:hypothetical protein
MYHLAENHVDIDTDALPKIPCELLVNAFITSEEERLLGIDAELQNSGRRIGFLVQMEYRNYGRN